MKCNWQDCSGLAREHPTKRIFLSYFCLEHQEKSNDIDRAWNSVEFYIKQKLNKIKKKIP